MIQTKTIALVLLIAIAAIGAIGIGIGTATQSAHGQEVNPSTGNPHPPGEPTGNPHIYPCSGKPQGQPGGGLGGVGFPLCPGAQ